MGTNWYTQCYHFLTLSCQLIVSDRSFQFWIWNIFITNFQQLFCRMQRILSECTIEFVCQFLRINTKLFSSDWTKNTSDFVSTMAFYYPVIGLLGFLSRKFLDFWHFLLRSWRFFLGKISKMLQDFSRLCKEIQENFWTSWLENQEYPRSWQVKQGSRASM